MRNAARASRRCRRTKRSVSSASSMATDDVVRRVRAQDPPIRGSRRRVRASWRRGRRAQPLDVDGQGRLAKGGTRADDGHEQAQGHDDGDGGADDRGRLERHEPGDRPERGLRDGQDGERDPCAPDDPAHPEAAPMRDQRRPDGFEDRVQRCRQDSPRVGWDHDRAASPARASVAGRPRNQDRIGRRLIRRPSLKVGRGGGTAIAGPARRTGRTRQGRRPTGSARSPRSWATGRPVRAGGSAAAPR